jgi:hypothetical protein
MSCSLQASAPGERKHSAVLLILKTGRVPTPVRVIRRLLAGGDDSATRPRQLNTHRRLHFIGQGGELV